MNILKVLLAATALVLLGGPLRANANIIYDWTGNCQVGCTGQAHMEIILPDAFVPGTPLLPVTGPPPLFLPRFPALSFFYSDNNFTVDLLPIPPEPGSMLLLPITSGPGSLSDITEPLSLTSPCHGGFCPSTNPGTWGLVGEIPGLSPGYVAAGSGGLWLRIPEPSTLVLLGVGVVGFGFVRRRRLS